MILQPAPPTAPPRPVCRGMDSTSCIFTYVWPSRSTYSMALGPPRGRGGGGGRTVPWGISSRLCRGLFSTGNPTTHQRGGGIGCLDCFCVFGLFFRGRGRAWGVTVFFWALLLRGGGGCLGGFYRLLGLLQKGVFLRVGDQIKSATIRPNGGYLKQASYYSKRVRVFQ